MIRINDKDYEFKYSLRALFMWEELTGKPFEIVTLFDTYILCYCCLLVGSENSLDFNDFIDAADKNPDIIKEFNEYLSSTMKLKELTDSKKKVTRGKNSQ